VIVSVSRRTDIPAFYADWFINRVRAGFCLVPNPFNPKQVSRVGLEPEAVDMFVFWSKHPAPLIPRLDELDRLGYRYYFLYTLNDYPGPLEPNLAPLDERIALFQTLSARLGAERVVWRYDPIIVSNRTDYDYHRRAFGRLVRALEGHTRRVVTSTLQFYAKTRRRLEALEARGFRFDPEAAGRPEMMALLADLAGEARSRGLEMTTCAEARDLSEIGLRRGSCIDGALAERIWGLKLTARKDPGQRPACRCIPSRDIGVTDSCLHDCPYCYATVSEAAARKRFREHRPDQPALGGPGVDPVPECRSGSGDLFP